MGNDVLKWYGHIACMEDNKMTQANNDMVVGRKMITRTTQNKLRKGSGKGEKAEFIII
jgi:hypothetical protein